MSRVDKIYLAGLVTTRTTFDIMYSEMQMDYDPFNSALQDIKWIGLHYIVDGHTSSNEIIDINTGTDLERIMLSLLSLVLLSYCHWQPLMLF